MKRFCERYGIRTASFAVFDDPDAADRYVREAGRPLVVKADGLAAGKGVCVADTAEDALAAIDRIMRKREFGDAGGSVVIEELLLGEEASFHVVSDGTNAVALAPAQDHKRVGDGDRGPNTGGMGAYAPAPVVDAVVHDRVIQGDRWTDARRGWRAKACRFEGPYSSASWSTAGCLRSWSTTCASAIPRPRCSSRPTPATGSSF